MVIFTLWPQLWSTKLLTILRFNIYMCNITGADCTSVQGVGFRLPSHWQVLADLGAAIPVWIKKSKEGPGFTRGPRQRPHYCNPRHSIFTCTQVPPPPHGRPPPPPSHPPPPSGRPSRSTVAANTLRRQSTKKTQQRRRRLCAADVFLLRWLGLNRSLHADRERIRSHMHPPDLPAAIFLRLSDSGMFFCGF